jgi:hypothetical protein
MLGVALTEGYFKLAFPGLIRINIALLYVGHLVLTRARYPSIQLYKVWVLVASQGVLTEAQESLKSKVQRFARLVRAFYCP